MSTGATSPCVRHQEHGAVRCYYDGECGFCQKWVERVRRVAGLPESAVLPAQCDPEINEIMERENSWVVVHPDGRRLLRWRALSLVIRQRILLWPIGALMLAPGVGWLGDRFYRWIAKNRGTL